MVTLVFLAQPDTPERVITADPDSWYRGDPQSMGADNYAEWRASTCNTEVVRTMLEDYRAGLTVAADLERFDRCRGAQLRRPALALWSEHDDLKQLFGDPIQIWRTCAADVNGQPSLWPTRGRRSPPFS